MCNKRLSKFRADNKGNIASFARAAHAIADFYAHSSYVHFANIKDAASDNGYAELYDPAQPTQIQGTPDYSSGSSFDLVIGKFSINPYCWKEQDSGKIATLWNGKIISGRYAQEHDTWPELISLITEGPTNIPADLLSTPDFDRRGSLPHHNEIAVDEDTLDHKKISYMRI